jgi:ATP-dependent Lon protease
LIPRQLASHGIDASLVDFEPDAITGIIRNYTREAGVRELERRLARISRKLARRVAEGGVGKPEEATTSQSPAEAKTEPRRLVVRAEDLRELLGVSPFDPDDQQLEDKVGVATGLAYTQVGGETLEIEVSVVSGRGKVQLTGTLGDVMKESASAAISYARSRAGAIGIDRDFYKTKDIHVHIPAGATPKDGPSAGIAIATAIVSALSGAPVRGDLAMTGEITLRGRVLPIGGLKEKSVAAHRNKIHHVIIPIGNAREIEELPEEVRTGIEFHPVANMDEVIAFALRPVPERMASPVPEKPPARVKRERPTRDEPLPVAH